MENDSDILAVVAASAALTLSGAAFKGPDRCGVSASSTTRALV
jgi:polyribonucleotide nucleotidyltransferase